MRNGLRFLIVTAIAARRPRRRPRAVRRPHPAPVHLARRITRPHRELRSRARAGADHHRRGVLRRRARALAHVHDLRAPRGRGPGAPRERRRPRGVDGGTRAVRADLDARRCAGAGAEGDGHLRRASGSPTTRPGPSCSRRSASASAVTVASPPSSATPAARSRPRRTWVRRARRSRWPGLSLGVADGTVSVSWDDRRAVRTGPGAAFQPAPPVPSDPSVLVADDSTRVRIGPAVRRACGGTCYDAHLFTWADGSARLVYRDDPSTWYVARPGADGTFDGAAVATRIGGAPVWTAQPGIVAFTRETFPGFALLPYGVTSWRRPALRVTSGLVASAAVCTSARIAGRRAGCRSEARGSARSSGRRSSARWSRSSRSRSSWRSRGDRPLGSPSRSATPTAAPRAGPSRCGAAPLRVGQREWTTR